MTIFQVETLNMRTVGSVVPGSLPFNAYDGVFQSVIPGQAPVWTQGNSLIDPIDTQPFLDNPWTIQSWAINFVGAVQWSVKGAGWISPSAKYGGIYAGIIIRPTLPITPIGNLVIPTYEPPGTNIGPTPFVPYAQAPIPITPGTIGVVWDPSTDPPLAQLSQSASGLALPQPIVKTQQLPVPIELASGDTLSCGLWVPPSLMSGPSNFIFVVNAQFSVTYTAERP